MTAATRRGRIVSNDSGGPRELAGIKEDGLGRLQLARAHQRANIIDLQDREASVDRWCAGGHSKGKARLYGQRGHAHQHWAVEESIHDAQQLVRRKDGGVGVEGQRGGLVFTACAADQGTYAVSGVTVLGG